MRNSLLAIFVLAVVVLLVAGLGGRSIGAPEETPAAVKKAVEKHFGKSKVTVTKEDEDGVVVYEAAVKTNLEVVFSPTGTVKETEVALPTASLPAAVVKSVTAKLAKGTTIGEAEVLITADGVYIEVETKLANGDEIEYLVAANGTILKEEREAAGKDDEDDDAR